MVDTSCVNRDKIIKIHSSGTCSADQSSISRATERQNTSTASMSYLLHASGVVTGSLSCFCLACDAFLQSARHATHHVGTAEHQQKAGAVQLSDRFPHDRIKKFKRGYYCEFCNVLMPIASKVNVHITEDEHKHNKGVLLLKPLGLDVVAFNNVLIEEKAWHGLIEGVCSLCNAEFEDEEDHKADAEHSLNLVLKPIQFGADNAIFRPLDDTAVQCLTCNKLLAPGRMSEHFVDAEHLALYAKQRIESNGACRGSETEEITAVTENNDEMKNSKIDNDVNTNNNRGDKNNDEKRANEDKSKILESIVRYQTKGMNINLETEIVFCKKCSQVVTFDFNEIEKHLDNHSSAAEVDSNLLYPSYLDQNLNRVDIKDKTPQTSDNQQNEIKETLKALPTNVQNDSSNDNDDGYEYETISTCSVDDFDNHPTENLEKDIEEEEEIRDFAKANKITYNRNNKKSFCRICEVHLPASLKSMKEHVEGTNHRRTFCDWFSKPSTSKSTTEPKSPGTLTKQATIDFLETAIHVRTMFYSGSVINEEYCIPKNSLFLISQNSSRTRCLLCDINLPPHSDVNEHANSTQHLDKWKKVPIITSEGNEFIREVRPGLYHCGYCHLVVSGWTDMKRHLKCFDHALEKAVCEERLTVYLPGVRQEIGRQLFMNAMARMRLFNMFH